MCSITTEICAWQAVEKILKCLQFYLMKLEGTLRGTCRQIQYSFSENNTCLSGKRNIYSYPMACQLVFYSVLLSNKKCREYINHFVVSSWSAPWIIRKPPPSLLNSSKLHLAETMKFRWTKRAREEQRSLLINEFGPALCLPHPARLRDRPPVYALYLLPRADWI